MKNETSDKEKWESLYYQNFIEEFIKITNKYSHSRHQTENFIKEILTRLHQQETIVQIAPNLIKASRIAETDSNVYHCSLNSSNYENRPNLTLDIEYINDDPEFFRELENFSLDGKILSTMYDFTISIYQLKDILKNSA